MAQSINKKNSSVKPMSDYMDIKTVRTNIIFTSIVLSSVADIVVIIFFST